MQLFTRIYIAPAGTFSAPPSAGAYANWLDQNSILTILQNHAANPDGQVDVFYANATNWDGGPEVYTLPTWQVCPGAKLPPDPLNPNAPLKSRHQFPSEQRIQKALRLWYRENGCVLPTGEYDPYHADIPALEQASLGLKTTRTVRFSVATASQPNGNPVIRYGPGIKDSEWTPDTFELNDNGVPDITLALDAAFWLTRKHPGAGINTETLGDSWAIPYLKAIAGLGSGVLGQWSARYW